ncbi:MAG: hypothetical protein ABI604_18675, partial [Nitrospirota bacterium]
MTLLHEIEFVIQIIIVGRTYPIANGYGKATGVTCPAMNQLVRCSMSAGSASAAYVENQNHVCPPASSVTR